MRRVIIVQARMTSTRLPGKVLKDVVGRPMLAQQLRRLQACCEADTIVVATTDLASDDPVAELARREGVVCFRGDEHDVLSRFVGAARVARADVVVRVTADCPLIDPGLVDSVITELCANSEHCDYASNVMPRTYPRGLDAEALFLDTLLRIDRLAQPGPAREHVTVLPRGEQRHLFLARSVVDAVDNSDLRWTVDTAADLELVRRLYAELDMSERVVPYNEILAFARAHPDLATVNAGIDTWNPS